MNDNMSWKIRHASKQDIEALDEAITDYNIRVAKELPRAEITRLDFAAMNAEENLLGGIQAYRVNRGILHVELLYVYEDYRQQGIASAFLEHVEKIAKDNRCYLAH